jgi:hypothetical protein
MYKREVERMLRDVKEGFMKKEDFELWKKFSKPKAIEKRSKIIIKMDRVMIEEENN